MPRIPLAAPAVAALALGLAFGASAAPPAAGPVAALHQFIDSFNKGDLKAAEAAHAADAVIIDEVPPHIWRGPNAVQAWAADLGKAAKAAGDTEQKVTLGAPVRTDVNGDTAYAVVPATYTYKENGKPMREPAQFAVALRKDGGAWKLAGWAWAGTKPRPAAAAAKPK
jgi:ketosteroid isomerase-like protein